MDAVDNALEQKARSEHGLVARSLIVCGVNWAYYLPYALIRPTTNSLTALLAKALGNSFLFFMIPLFPILFFQRRRAGGGVAPALAWGGGIAALFFVDRWFHTFANAHW